LENGFEIPLEHLDMNEEQTQIINGLYDSFSTLPKRNAIDY